LTIGTLIERGWRLLKTRRKNMDKANCTQQTLTLEEIADLLRHHPCQKDIPGADWDDIQQEVLLKICRRGGSVTRPYLNRVLRSTRSDYYRKRRKESMGIYSSSRDDPYFTDSPSPLPSPAEELERKETPVRVQQFLDRVAPEYRQVFKKWMDGETLSHRERARFCRLKKKLRKEFPD
jgi:DNA-directed RNA polymerase specialized sigma24 family protein